MNFEQALALIKTGHLLTRPSWNGKGMYVLFVSGQMIRLYYPEYPYESFVAIKTADEKMIPWVISQSDLLAEDWQEFEE